MSKDNGILHCVLKKEWFEKIKSGLKTHEYREVKEYWLSRIYVAIKRYGLHCGYTRIPICNKVLFSLGMSKAPEKTMLFEIKNIKIVNGLNTDLKIDKDVFDIELGRRIS